jgi:hypothetical protein
MFRRFRSAVALGVLGLVLVGVGSLTSWRPFEPDRTDDSGPVLLQSVRDLQRVVPAQGTFEVTVLLREGHEHVPTWVYGYEGALLAHGTVDAYVDLAGLPADAVTVSPDRSAVAVALPEPRLTAPAIDHGRSQVIDNDRGIVTAVAEAFDGKVDRTQALYRAAEVKLAAAAEASELRARAERNTGEMLREMGRSLGFETVEVSFRPVT